MEPLTPKLKKHFNDIKEMWSDLASGKLKPKKYNLPDLKTVLENQKMSLECPYCKRILTTKKWTLINKGILCRCDALLTDQGNAWKVETAKEPYELTEDF